MWNKTTYPFLVQALCIIPLKSIRMWASFAIFVEDKTRLGKIQIKFAFALGLFVSLLHSGLRPRPFNLPERRRSAQTAIRHD